MAKIKKRHILQARGVKEEKLEEILLGNIQKFKHFGNHFGKTVCQFPTKLKNFTYKSKIIHISNYERN